MSPEPGEIVSEISRNSEMRGRSETAFFLAYIPKCGTWSPYVLPMRDKTKKYTGILLLDPFLDGLLSPFIVPVVKFWVDQKVDAILFGYAVGAGAVLTLAFYQALDWWQKRRRKALNDSAHIAVISYPVVLVAFILGYVPLLFYAALGANGYFIVAIFTGSFYYFCVRNHLRYLKRRLFTLEERELFDRKADQIGNVASIGALLLLTCFMVDPTRLNPVTALVGCFLLSDIGLVGAFTYFYIRLEARRGTEDGDRSAQGRLEPKSSNMGKNVLV
jgi:hypothetical protein